MKKHVILSIAMASAVIAGSVPMTSQAANIKAVRLQTGNFCENEQAGTYSPIYSGKDLQKLLKELGVTEKGCFNITLPGTSSPEKPEGPDSGIQTPVGPDTQKPEQGGTEDSVLSQAAQVAELVNAERAKAGLPALQLQTDLTRAANVRAREIKQKFSHTRPDGSNFSSVLAEQGISYRMSGENIAYGQSSPQAVMEGWMNSSGHRANILNSNFKNIGVGLYQDERGVNHWVQLFT